MMERKLWFKIFALLLLVLSALASDDNETSLVGTVAPESPAAPSSAPGTVAAGPESGSRLEESGQVIASNNNTATSPSSGLNRITEEKRITLIPLNTSNGTSTTNSSEFINETISATTTSLPTLENQNSTTEFTTISTTTLSSTKKTETSPVPTSPSSLETTNTSQPNVSIHTDNNTSTSKPTESTSSLVTTSASTTTTASTTQESTATKTKSTTSTTHLEVPSESSVATHKAITPSQQNVGEDTTAVHEAPALDPLLAGLVSAFIIAAVIITLLLFLKLRRRDNRPEFRRLQDLPMDDMMEDTPLSMYSY